MLYLILLELINFSLLLKNIYIMKITNIFFQILKKCHIVYIRPMHSSLSRYSSKWLYSHKKGKKEKMGTSFFYDGAIDFLPFTT